MFNRLRCTTVVLTVICVAFLIAGFALIIFSDLIIKKAVKKQCQLEPGALAYEMWRDAPVPFYISIYVFDLENEKDFINGAKPRLTQRGPFVYREQRTKEDIRLYPNGTISYREARQYTFDRSRSSDDETLMISTINVVYMTLINYLQSENIPSTVRKIIGTVLSPTEKLIMQRTVREYLWGYSDPLLKMLKTFLPDLVSNDQISVFASVVNEAQYETILINNGVGLDENGLERIGHVGRIERFNFSTDLSTWSNKYANMINGTDSTIWHPDTRKDELIYTFANDICRSVHLKFNQTRRNSFAIDTYQYLLPDDIFANSSENEGFCMNYTNSDGKQQLKCLPSGLFSLSSCVHLSGSAVPIPLPIIASNPHFLAADPVVQAAVDGLTPDEVLHRSYIDIEPMTGLVMNGSRRMQFNINVVNDSKIDAISHIRPSVYPMIWVNEHAEIDKSNADVFRSKVLAPLTLLSVLKYVFVGLGIFFAIVVLDLLIYRQYKKKTTVVAVPIVATDETTPLLE